MGQMAPWIIKVTQDNACTLFISPASFPWILMVLLFACLLTTRVCLPHGCCLASKQIEGFSAGGGGKVLF